MFNAWVRDWVENRCLVRLINQEKGESVSMHTVASRIHMAYWEVFILFFSLFYCVTQCFKCLTNITHFLFLIFLIATNGVLKKEKKKRNEEKTKITKKKFVLVEENILTVQKSSTFHCLDPNCVRRCNNKSSGFYLFTKWIWLYCTVLFSFLWVEGGWGTHLKFLTCARVSVRAYVCVLVRSVPADVNWRLRENSVNVNPPVAFVFKIQIYLPVIV